jgi:cell division protein FtsB
MRRRFATAIVGVAACVLLAHVVLGANGIAVYLKKRDENKQLNNQIQTLQEQNAKLEKNIDSLKHDPQAIEKEAREQLKYAKPGEVVYTLPEDKTRQAAAQTAQNEKKTNGASTPVVQK